MTDELGYGWAQMVKDGDADELPTLTEPVIVRVQAVGGTQVRMVAGALYIEGWERLPSELRVASRWSMTPEAARDLMTKLRKVLNSTKSH